MLILKEKTFKDMPRYFVQLSFMGSGYHGWQIQPNALSVQEVVEKAFSTILREEIQVVGAGRTDAGVHAKFFVLHFDCSQEIADFQRLIFRLNGFLPSDIAIQKIWEVSEDDHARFSAVSRTYHYYITTVKNPFTFDTAFYYSGKLDVDKMNETAAILLKTGDFTSFSRLHSDVKTNICKVYHAEWVAEGERLIFKIRADRFLRNMVRAIVGTLLEVGKGKLSADDFRKIIEMKDRGAAGASAPAHALFLVDIEY